MSRKRSSFEISAEILKVALGGAKKSRLVYQANLNFGIIKGYLLKLSKSGLLQSPMNGSKLYTTTDKGIEFINYFEGMKQFATN
ncbi:MAG: winged helix-turn-helix domain-containing protein [Candidatus Bathyarchaeota archaeon]|jgi:predicted transcriptional regulator|nr:winged helix-turn-helix domain-containing protein [Candidatus Bathyarchaeota archaeon]